MRKILELIAVVGVCFSLVSCGEVDELSLKDDVAKQTNSVESSDDKIPNGDEDQSSEDDTSSQTKNESINSVNDDESEVSDENSEHIKLAQEVTTKFFSFMSNGEYSKAKPLCTEELINAMSLDDYTDGEDIEKADVEFLDESYCEEQSDGSLLIYLKCNIIAEEDEILAVWVISCNNDEYKIADTGPIDDESLSTATQMESYIKKSKQKTAESNTKTVYIIAVEYLINCQAKKIEVADGVYTSVDKSELTANVIEQLPLYTGTKLDDDYTFEITVKDYFVEKVVCTQDDISAQFPKES